MIHIKQENIQITYEQVAEFQVALNKINRCEYAPNDEELEGNLLSQEISIPLGRLQLALKDIGKLRDNEVVKVENKYDKLRDPKTEKLSMVEFKKMKEEVKKINETTETVMLPIIPALDKWGDFKYPFQIVSLLDPLFSKEKPPKEKPK